MEEKLKLKRLRDFMPNNVCSVDGMYTYNQLLEVAKIIHKGYKDYAAYFEKEILKIEGINGCTIFDAFGDCYGSSVEHFIVSLLYKKDIKINITGVLHNDKPYELRYDMGFSSNTWGILEHALFNDAKKCLDAVLDKVNLYIADFVDGYYEYMKYYKQVDDKLISLNDRLLEIAKNTHVFNFSFDDKNKDLKSQTEQS